MLDYQPGKFYLIQTCTDTEAEHVRVTDSREATLLYRDGSNQNKILLLAYQEKNFEIYFEDYGTEPYVRFTFTFLIVGHADVQKVVYALCENVKEKILRIVKET